MPEFPGGLAKLIAFAKGNMKYPQTAINDHIKGSVILQFIIDEKGKVTDEKIIKTVRTDAVKKCEEFLTPASLYFLHFCNN